MLPSVSKHYHFWVQGLCFFAAAALFIVGCGYNMILDSDPLWHVAAGDLIRAQGSIPLHDPWSFTAGDYRWLNVSWLWDAGFSYIVEKIGWSGAAAANGIIIAAILALVYTHCVLRSGNGIASFITIVLLVMMFHLHLRSLHVTHLMIALWMLLLGLYTRNECRAGWLALLPLTMLLWVNSHGGFIMGYVVIGAFGLGALLQRNSKQFTALVIVSLFCVAAAFCNPYGIGIIETVLRPLTTVANEYIVEWQPVTLNVSTLINCLYLVLFVALVIGRPSFATLPEKLLAYTFLLYGLTTSRALHSFIIIGAPLLAYRLSFYFKESGTADQRALNIRQAIYDFTRTSSGLLISSALALCAIIVATSNIFLQLFPQTTEWPRLEEEIAFIEQHYPKGRFLNDFQIGGYIAYETRGRIPVFIDARTETAFPREIMEDYFAFLYAGPGWDNIVSKYDITGIIILNSINNALHERLSTRKGWKTAFKGKDATIYIRSQD